MKDMDLSVKQIKMIAIGGLSIAFVGMAGFGIFTSMNRNAFNSSNKNNTDTEEITIVNQETMVVEQKKGVTEKTEDEIKKIKDEVWSLLEDLNTDEASKKMLEVYKTVVFTEENELEKWHLDVSLVSTAAMLPYNERTEMFANLEMPRFKTAFSVFASPLNVSELVADKESLIPIDVKSFWVEKESYLTKDEFETLGIDSKVANDLKEQTETFYVADILYDDTKVQGVSAILESGDVILIGYFSTKETPYETAKFWEENRRTFENISALE